MINGDSADNLGAVCSSEDPTLTHPLQLVAFLSLEGKTEVKLPSKDIKLQKCFGPKELNLGIKIKAANM